MEYHARDRQNPGLQEVIEAIVAATWKATHASGLQAETQRIVETAVAEHLLALAANGAASSGARAIARAEAVSLRDWIAGTTAEAPEDRALYAATVARIDLLLTRPDKFTPAPAPAVPPGQPIGDEE